MAADPGRGIAYFHLNPVFAWTIFVAVLGGAVTGGTIIWNLSDRLADHQGVVSSIREQRVIERITRLEERANALRQEAVIERAALRASLDEFRSRQTEALSELHREIESLRSLMIRQYSGNKDTPRL